MGSGPGENLIIGCARRKSSECAFGRGFDSHHFHQNLALAMPGLFLLPRWFSDVGQRIVSDFSKMVVWLVVCRNSADAKHCNCWVSGVAESPHLHHIFGLGSVCLPRLFHCWKISNLKVFGLFLRMSFEDDIPVTDRFRVVSDGRLVVYLVV